MTKTCTKCGNKKPLEQFVKSTKTEDGRRKLCKTCHNAYYTSKPKPSLWEKLKRLFK